MRISGKRGSVVVAFVLLVLFWGSAFSVVKVGLEYSPPVIFAGLRSLVGGLAMLPAALVWGGRPNLRRDWSVFLLLALFNVVLFFGLQTFAIMHLPSGTAAVLIYLQPILVGVLAWPILGEPLSAAKLAGLLLGFAGIVVVSAGGFSGALSPAGVAFAAASALAWALGTVYFKEAQRRVSILWAIAAPFLAGGASLTVLGLILESPRASRRRARSRRASCIRRSWASRSPGCCGWGWCGRARRAGSRLTFSSCRWPRS